MKYMNITHLSEFSDTCKKTVRKQIKEMKLSGAYPRECFLTNPERVEVAAFVHFNTYQQAILSGKKFPEWR